MGKNYVAVNELTISLMPVHLLYVVQSVDEDMQ